MRSGSVMTRILGKLNQVSVSDIWRYEQVGFTPWLASEDGLAELGASIGLDLVNPRTEVDVGTFRADIVCELASAHNVSGPVVIENQLDQSDHKHLGQLLTYGSGLQAGTCIWIATSFTKEHLKAVDDLNRMSDGSRSFYCVQLSAWTIDGGRPAAAFGVLVAPDRTNPTRHHVALPSKHVHYLAKFWAKLDQRLAEAGKPQSRPGKWLEYRRFPIKDVHACFSLARTIESNRARLYIYRKGDSVYWRLARDRDTISHRLGTLGDTVAWNPPRGRRSSIDFSTRSHVYDESRWDDEIDWMIQRLDLLAEVFLLRLESVSESNLEVKADSRPIRRTPHRRKLANGVGFRIAA